MAQAATASELRETVVTATRVEQPLSDLVADVSIIDSETIQRSGAVGVADILARVPGIQITRNGGPGSNASVYVRGGETRFTAVYIDGVRVDSQSTGGATWEQIPLSQIDRIEVLRGPAAAVYGSDAVSGVIQLFTKKGEGKPAPYVGVGFGNRGTYTAEAGVSGAAGAFDYSLGMTHERSDGFNARPIPTDARCPVCGMYPARFPRWAAQIIFKDGAAHFFDSPVDLFMFLDKPARFGTERNVADAAAIYVADFRSGTWLAAREAVFVRERKPPETEAGRLCGPCFFVHGIFQN